MNKFFKGLLLGLSGIFLISFVFAGWRTSNRSVYDMIAKRFMFTSDGTTSGSPVFEINNSGQIITYQAGSLIHTGGDQYLFGTGSDNKICLWHTNRLVCETSPTSGGAETDPIYMAQRTWVLSGSQTVWTGIIKGGINTVASGSQSMTIGSQTQATNFYSFAGGDRSIASGSTSFAFGLQSTAQGNYSVALGYSGHAIGGQSVAFGGEASAEGPRTLAMGHLSRAIGGQSIALGKNSLSSGANSVALGYHSKSIQDGSFVIGRANSGYTNAKFELGIGSFDLSRKNAITIWNDDTMTFHIPIKDGAGNAYITGAILTETDPIWILQSGNYLLKANSGTYYTSNPLGFITGSALSPYLLIVNSGDVYRENPAGYVTGLTSISGVIIGSDYYNIGNNIISGSINSALGFNNKIGSSYSGNNYNIVNGYNNIVGTGFYTGNFNNVIGANNTVDFHRNTVVGYNNVMKDWTSLIFGDNNIISGLNSMNYDYDHNGMIIGYNNILGGDINNAYVASNIVGSYSQITGTYSTSIGYYNKIHGSSATALGYNNIISKGNDVISIGSFNTITGISLYAVKKSKIGIGNELSVGGSNQIAIGTKNLNIHYFEIGDGIIESPNKSNLFAINSGGAIILKNNTTTTTCNSTYHGTIKFSGDNFYGCKTSGWVLLN